MAISYLSQPIVSQIQPYIPPYEAMLAVTKERAQMFDQLLSARFTYDNVIGNMYKGLNIATKEDLNKDLETASSELDNAIKKDLFVSGSTKELEKKYDSIINNSDYQYNHQLALDHEKQLANIEDAKKKNEHDQLTEIAYNYEINKVKNANREDLRRQSVNPYARKTEDLYAFMTNNFKNFNFDEISIETVENEIRPLLATIATTEKVGDDKYVERINQLATIIKTSTTTDKSMSYDDIVNKLMTMPIPSNIQYYEQKRALGEIISTGTKTTAVKLAQFHSGLLALDVAKLKMYNDEISAIKANIPAGIDFDKLTSAAGLDDNTYKQLVLYKRLNNSVTRTQSRIDNNTQALQFLTSGAEFKPEELQAFVFERNRTGVVDSVAVGKENVNIKKELDVELKEISAGINSPANPVSLVEENSIGVVLSRPDPVVLSAVKSIADLVSKGDDDAAVSQILKSTEQELNTLTAQKEVLQSNIVEFTQQLGLKLSNDITYNEKVKSYESQGFNNTEAKQKAAADVYEVFMKDPSKVTDPGLYDLFNRIETTKTEIKLYDKAIEDFNYENFEKFREGSWNIFYEPKTKDFKQLYASYLEDSWNSELYKALEPVVLNSAVFKGLITRGAADLNSERVKDNMITEFVGFLNQNSEYYDYLLTNGFNNSKTVIDGKNGLQERFLNYLDNKGYTRDQLKDLFGGVQVTSQLVEVFNELADMENYKEKVKDTYYESIINKFQLDAQYNNPFIQLTLPVTSGKASQTYTLASTIGNRAASENRLRVINDDEEFEIAGQVVFSNLFQNATFINYDPVNKTLEFGASGEINVKDNKEVKRLFGANFYKLELTPEENDRLFRQYKNDSGLVGQQDVSISDWQDKNQKSPLERTLERSLIEEVRRKDDGYHSIDFSSGFYTINGPFVPGTYKIKFYLNASSNSLQYDAIFQPSDRGTAQTILEMSGKSSDTYSLSFFMRDYSRQIQQMAIENKKRTK